MASSCGQLINPFVDDLPATQAVTTASVEGTRSASATPSQRRRDFEPARVEAHVGSVSHWPLWYEDPFEDRGSEDGRFAGTWEDGFCFVYGLGRFILNTMSVPVSAAVVPRFTVMCSDGRISRQTFGRNHDAQGCPAGTPVPLDTLEVGTALHETEPASPGSSSDSADG